MSEMTDIEKQRGKEYSKEELFEALSAAKKEAESAEAERDRYKKVLEILSGYSLGTSGPLSLDDLIETALSGKGE